MQRPMGTHMQNDLTQEIQSRLQKDHGFKLSGLFLRGGKCPNCGKQELWTQYEKPYYIKCSRENNCGNEWNIKDFLPEVFENLNERYPATSTNPHHTADAYLTYQRELDINQLKGSYEQHNYWKSNANKGTATVRFYLRANKSVYWERLIEEITLTDKNGGQKTKKMDFGPYGCSYKGLWWQPPTVEIEDNSEVIWTEGIIDALSLVQNGYQAVAIMSANGFPMESLTPYLGKGITWILGLDNDKAGQKYLQKHLQKLRELGEKVSAIISSEDSQKTDWNDLHKTQQLTKKHLQKYRLAGQIAIAESKEEKAYYIYQQYNEAKKHYVMSYNNITYSISVDKALYDEESRTLEKTPEKLIRIKLQAFKHAVKLTKIANFRMEYLYYQQPEHTAGKYTLRLHFENRAPSSELTISHTAFSSSSKFKEALLSAHGGMFDGDTKDINYLYNTWVQYWKKTVKYIDYIGYDSGTGSKSNQGTKAYIFHDIAVQNGQVIKQNPEGYFSLKNGIGIKSGINNHYQDISITEPVNFLTDLEQAFGAKGIIGLANLVGSLFAEQISDYLGCYYFFEMWDEKGGSGKSSLAIFLLKLIGRDLNEFNPNTGTQSGRSRRFADTSNMPIVLNETDSVASEKRQHNKKFCWDMDSKPLYDRMVGNPRATFTNDNQSHTSRFRAALWVIQNIQVNAERSTLSRFISLYFDTKHHSHAGHAAAIRLKELSKKDVSGFLIKTLKSEHKLIADFKQHYRTHNKRLQNQGLKDQRVIDNHAHLHALLDLLPIVVPITDTSLSAAKTLVDKMAHEREQLLQQDHPIIQDFWQTYTELNSGLLKRKRLEGPYNTDLQIQEDTYIIEEDQLNHSRDESRIALSLIEYVKACKDQGIYTDIKELRQQLIHSKTPKYIDSNVTVNSKVTGKSIRCMTFRK